MSRFVRACLAWVMAVLMPLQGMAAPMMHACGSNHDRMAHQVLDGAPAAVPSLATASRHGHDGPHLGTHAPSAPGLQAADEPASASDTGAGTGHSPEQGHGSCSACAACCVAIALPASSVQQQAAIGAAFARAPSAAPVATHPPDGLDRPPRSVLA